MITKKTAAWAPEEVKSCSLYVSKENCAVPRRQPSQLKWLRATPLTGVRGHAGRVL